MAPFTTSGVSNLYLVAGQETNSAKYGGPY